MKEKIVSRILQDGPIVASNGKVFGTNSCDGDPGKASAIQSASSTSIGLVVKQYWNKMVQVYTVVQQLQSEV